MKTTAIILAAGSGSRMELGHNKILHEIGKPLLAYTLETFSDSTYVDDIIIVINENDRTIIEEIASPFAKVQKIVLGGTTRQTSSLAGVQAADDADIVIVHDAARIFISQNIIERSIADAKEHSASIVCVKVKDTIKQACSDGAAKPRTTTSHGGVGAWVERTLPREHLWVAQTPQTFKREVIIKAHKEALKDEFTGTDEASLVERLGMRVKITEGSYANIKVTTPEDLEYAKIILKK